MHATDKHPRRGLIVRRLADAIQHLGHVVRIQEVGENGGPVRYWRARKVVANAIRKHQPDILHIHFGYSGLAVPSTDIPIVASFYGDDLLGTATEDGGTTFKSRLGILASQFTAWRSKCCIVVSEQMKERLWWSAARIRAIVVRD